MKPALIQPMKKNWRRKVNKKHTKDAPCNSTGCGVEDLLAEATLANSDFESLFNHFVERTRCDTGLYELWGKASTVDASGNKTYVTTQHGRIIMNKKKRKVTSYGSLKGAPRIEQKCLTKYKNRAAATGKAPAGYINDVVRGTITFRNCADMLGALNYIESKENKAVPGLNFKYTVVRIKQIYDPRSSLLYGDVKLNIQIKTASVAHNCELQLNHLEMIKAKGTTAGHGAYESWRNMDDEHWKNEQSEMPAKVENMTGEYQRKAKEIIRKSQGAYSNAAMTLTNDSSYQAMLNKVKTWSSQIKAKVNEHTIKCYDGTYVH
ncbi:MAG: hypothetical protein MI863_16860 [Desulfobacterales bacterium]|nr:hypothetical protein [Desulfobacterales bacterium]